MTCPADYVCFMYPTYFAPLMIGLGVGVIFLVGVMFAAYDRWRR